MQIGICSFSFHRLLAAGKQDIFKYITDCKELGCTQLDPWNAHLAALSSGDEVLHAGHNPGQSQHLTAVEDGYIEKVKAAADAAGLPFGCIATDGAHIYEENPEACAANRARAYRWIDICGRLGAAQIRIDAGGPEQFTHESWAMIKVGYEDVISYAQTRGVQVLFENHWGPTVLPENCLRLLKEIPDLGMLLDTHNFKAEYRDEGRAVCAPYASAVHIKTLDWDAQGNEVGEDIPEAIRLLLEAGYKGCWSVESCPADGDEYGGVKKTIALIKHYVHD